MVASADVAATRGAVEAPGPRVLPLRAAGIVVARQGRRLLDSVDVEVAEPGVTVVMGPNGAGKSLLLRVLANLVVPDQGAVLWAGQPPDRARAGRIGFVFQRPVVLRRSVLRNVTYVLAAAGVPRRLRPGRARAALALASLEHLAGVPAGVLSGGERQRLAMARALATEPEVLLLDEPAASLDPAATFAVERLVRVVSRSATKVVLVTHDVAEARRLGDRILFMHRGRIHEKTPAERFFDAPASEPARDYLAGRILL